MQRKFCWNRRADHSSAIRVAVSINGLIAACIFASCATADDVADPDPTRFEQDIRAFEAWDRQNSFPPNAVLFVGSSSIRMWQTAESFPGVPLINRGFGGSHISDVNYFAERIVVKYKPRLIVFYAGDNDIESGKSPQQVFDDFLTFAGLVHEHLPQTQIIYLPIKPSLARWTKWPRMQEANDHVKRVSLTNSRIIYVDTATIMLSNDGQPRSDLFLDDGLHLNDTGYQLWTKVLSPPLRNALAAE
jgi:lysophospholipase L1-like esterase